VKEKGIDISVLGMFIGGLVFLSVIWILVLNLLAEREDKSEITWVG
jgi:hypothetical protein